jgi:demethylmenaquinone methyltransferase / 2-methoxy-6-polyprenyl-1,4-benzoquinol methylase
MTALPYIDSELSKKTQVEDMFDNISPRYDFLNHLLSFNIDRLWRRKAIDALARFSPDTILDVATGTADLAIEASRLKPGKIIGIDLSCKMLEIGRAKIKKRGLSDLITLQKADSEALPFKDDSFDAATIGFGIRNFENTGKGLQEIFRVLNGGGAFIVLEFSQPRKKIISKLYFFYFSVIMPALGRFVSKNNRAYFYLPESVKDFPRGDDFISLLKRAGFENCKYLIQTFGIATIYICQKPKNPSHIQ